MDAPPQLMFSALTWDGWPRWYEGDDGPDIHIGTYKETSSVRLQKRGPSAIEQDAVEYAPVVKTLFRYKREAYTGSVPDDASATIVGLDVSPAVMSICLPGRAQWPERFPLTPEGDPLPRSLTGPPFEFYSADIDNYTAHWRKELLPDGLHGLYLSGPDLPWHGEQDPFDSDYWHAWRGDWVTELLEQEDKRRDRNQPLGQMEKILWKYSKDGDRMWGVELRLEALQVQEFFEDGRDSDDEDEDSEGEDDTRTISEYTVRATVLRVFLTEKELARLHEPDPPVQEDEDERDSEDPNEDAAEQDASAGDSENVPNSAKRKAEVEPGEELLHAQEAGGSKKRVKTEK